MKKYNNFENLFENISLRKKLLDYINDIHLNESKLQIESIKKGISKVLPLSILNFYTYKEIEKLICGENKIDIELLKKNTIISSEIKSKDTNLVGNMASEGTTPRQLTDLIGSLSDLTSGSGDKGTPVVLIQGYFDNYTN